MKSTRLLATLLLVALCTGFYSCSKDDDATNLNNEDGNGTITGTTAKIDLKKAGSLSTLISDNVKFNITDLTITGDLNGDDIILIREMAGADMNGDETKGNLSILNLKDANIVAGGNPYYVRSTSEAFYTKQNILGSYMFRNCSKLTNIIFPNSATEIESYIFEYTDDEDYSEDNTTLTSVVIGDKVNSIGYSAFRGCSKLANVNIPNGVEDINRSAFSGCASLTRINIAFVSRIGEYAFGGCNLVEFIVSEDNYAYSSLDGVLFNKDKSKLVIYPKARPNQSYVIPNSVVTIEDAAFDDCSLTSITIGDGITLVSNTMFNSNLAEYIVSEGNSNYSSLDGVLFNKDKTELIAYPESKSGSSYTVPNSVNTIRDKVFTGCKNLTTININNVTQLPANSFTGSPIRNIIVSDTNSTYSSLNGVLFNKKKTSLIAYPMVLIKDYEPNGKGSSYTIPDGVERIYSYAFYPIMEIVQIDDVTSLKTYLLETLTIPTSVQNIGLLGIYGALNIHCKSEIPPSIENTMQKPFSGRNIYVPMNAVNTYKQANGWKDNNIIGE